MGQTGPDQADRRYCHVNPTGGPEKSREQRAVFEEISPEWGGDSEIWVEVGGVKWGISRGKRPNSQIPRTPACFFYPLTNALIYFCRRPICLDRLGFLKKAAVLRSAASFVGLSFRRVSVCFSLNLRSVPQ